MACNFNFIKSTDWHGPEPTVDLQVWQEKIRCPGCNLVQLAFVTCPVEFPFASYVHFCTRCPYIITESEWNRVDKPSKNRQKKRTKKSGVFQRLRKQKANLLSNRIIWGDEVAYDSHMFNFENGFHACLFESNPDRWALLKTHTDAGLDYHELVGWYKYSQLPAMVPKLPLWRKDAMTWMMENSEGFMRQRLSYVYQKTILKRLADGYKDLRLTQEQHKELAQMKIMLKRNKRNKKLRRRLAMKIERLEMLRDLDPKNIRFEPIKETKLRTRKARRIRKALGTFSDHIKSTEQDLIHAMQMPRMLLEQNEKANLSALYGAWPMKVEVGEWQ